MCVSRFGLTQVLADFQRMSPSVRQTPTSLKAYLRRGIEADQQTPPPPPGRPVPTSLKLAARPAAASTTKTAAPHSMAAVMPGIVPSAAPVQPTTQAPSNDGQKGVRPHQAVVTVWAWRTSYRQ